MEKTVRRWIGRRALLTLLALTGAMLLPSIPAIGEAAAVTIVTLGASNTYGKGVARAQAYPAQLEALLRAKGQAVQVINAGINGDTTAGMLNRIGTAVPSGTSIVILQPGGNDQRKGQGAATAGNVATIEAKLRSRGIRVVMLPNEMLPGLPHQADGEHLTPAGYRMLAEALLPQVTAALGR
jgi:acyl-CoA thioesterase I